MGESFHIPRALSDEALRLLTTLPMEEIERRLRMDGPAGHERPTDEQLDDLFVEIDGGGETQSWRAFARAVLARYGIIPAPIPTSERLPGPEDFDDDGNCWWYSFLEYAWTFANLKYAKQMRFRCWLPAHALPLPEGE